MKVLIAGKSPRQFSRIEAKACAYGGHAIYATSLEGVLAALATAEISRILIDESFAEGDIRKIESLLPEGISLQQINFAAQI